MGSRALSLPLPPSRTLLPSFHSLIHSLIHSPLIHSFTCSFTRLVIHSSVRWIIHALTLSHSYPCKQLPRLRAGRLDKRLFTSRSRSSAEAFAPAVEQEAQLSAELPCSCSVGPRTQPRPPPRGPEIALSLRSTLQQVLAAGGRGEPSGLAGGLSPERAALFYFSVLFFRLLTAPLRAAAPVRDPYCGERRPPPYPAPPKPRSAPPCAGLA